MWKLAFVLCLLPSSVAFAGETRGQLNVGLIITGPGNGSTVSAAAAAVGNTRVSVPLPRKRPASIGSGTIVPPGR